MTEAHPVPARGAYLAYRTGAELLRLAPGPLASGAAAAGAVVVGALQPSRRRIVADNLRRVVGGAAGPGEGRLRRLTWRAYAAYGRYWADVARLGATEHGERRSFSLAGEELLREALDAGRGAVLALPHLGCWEVGGRWLAAQGYPLTTVVEPVQPPELFRWFVGAREAIGIRVLALGPGAAPELLATLRRGGPIALLADRDLTGDGVPVEFFGEQTTLPAGPALLALRSGAPLLPCAVFHLRGGAHHGMILPPLDTARSGRLGADVARVTAELAAELERLIRLAPEQWHVFQPRFGQRPLAG